MLTRLPIGADLSSLNLPSLPALENGWQGGADYDHVDNQNEAQCGDAGEVSSE